MTVGEKIQMLRKQKNLTRLALKNLSGVSDTTIKQYENGSRQPQAKQLSKIANALDVSVDYLLGEELEIIPGRLKFISIDNPDSKDMKYVIEATDQESYDIGMQIFNDAGFDLALGKRLLAAFDSLNDKGQHIAVARVEELTRIFDYQKEKKG